MNGRNKSRVDGVFKSFYIKTGFRGAILAKVIILFFTKAYLKAYIRGDSKSRGERYPCII